jgi:hypothetical protein
MTLFGAPSGDSGLTISGCRDTRPLPFLRSLTPTGFSLPAVRHLPSMSPFYPHAAVLGVQKVSA